MIDAALLTLLCVEYPGYTIETLMRSPIATIQVLAREMEARAERAKAR